MKRILTFLSSMALVLPAIAADPLVPYPEEYRGWHHVKTMVIEEGHPLYEAFGGIHHLYANPQAVAGYQAGEFPDGAIIVFDLLEAISADNAVIEGTRKVVGVMHKDARAYAATGGWGFEGFGGGDRANRVVGGNAASACFACHEPQKDHDYVFSRLRD